MWVTRNLHRGDLHALEVVANGVGSAPDEDQIERLSKRGFVTQKANKVTVTAKGRLALVIRRFIFR
jgi:uncharacterized protein YpbB